MQRRFPSTVAPQFYLFVVELEVSKMLISKLNTIGDEDLWDEKKSGLEQKNCTILIELQ